MIITLIIYYRRKLYLLAVIGFFFISSGHAQSTLSADSASKLYVDTLIRSMQRGPDDDVRIEANRKFNLLFFEALQKPGSFVQRFDTLKNVSIVGSPDGKFRIYTWSLAKYDGTQYSYFGYLHLRNKDGSYKIIPLSDSTQSILKPESEKLKAERWLGCVYYEVIPVKKSGVTYYTLLGWKGVNSGTTRKIIEVLYFDKDIPKFGYPLLKAGRVFRNRMIYSFIAQVSMTLRYEEGKKLIVLDHLSDQSGRNETGALSTSAGPDGTYDAFKFKGGRWILMKDIDIRSDWKPRKNVPKAFGEED